MSDDLIVRLKAALADRYNIERELGCGGMATVYLAQDLKHEREVALKVLRPELGAAIGPERFLREMRITARLTHPHILPLHDSGEVDGFLFYTMPYVDGESLRDRLNRDKQLPIEETLRLVREVADALNFAHEHNVIHRDIKPENILIEAGHAVVADFGLAKAITGVGENEITETGLAVGTPTYVSPEQASGEEVDGRSDTYSLACVLYEMLAGEPPYSGRTAQTIIARHMQDRLPSLEVLRPSTPRHVTLAIETALGKVPADRFPNVKDFATALEAGEADVGEVGARYESKRSFFVGALVVAIVLVALGTWVIQARQTASLDSNKIVVFPLEEVGLTESDAGAGYDVALMIGAALEHTAPLKWIDGRTRFAYVAQAGVVVADVNQIRAICLDRSARYYVDGVVRVRDTSATVVLRLHDVSGDSLVAQKSAFGSIGETDFAQLGLSAIRELLPPLVEPGREIDLAPLQDRSAAAIALWVQGEREYRFSHFEEALGLYKRAVQADSNMVLAAVKAAQAASWKNLHDEAQQMLDLALARDSLLPPRYRYLARGLQGYLAGAADSAVAWFDLALSEDPEWVEPLAALGEVFYHLLPKQAGLDTRAESLFRASAQSDSGLTTPLYHLAEIAVRNGDFEEADVLIQRLHRVSADGIFLAELDLMYRCAKDGIGSVDWDAAVDDNARVVWDAAKSLSVAGAEFACAESGFRALLHPEVESLYHWGAFLTLQGILAAQGREAEVVDLADSLIHAGVPVAQIVYVIDAVAGVDLDAKAVEVIEFARGVWGEDYLGIQSDYLLWLFGVWHGYQSEADHVRILRSELIRRADSSGNRHLRLFAEALGGHLSLALGDTSGAVQQFRSLTPIAPRNDLEWEIAESVPAARMQLARVLFARGEYDEAREVAQVFDHPGPVVFLPFLPASLEIRYRSAVAAGRSRLADTYRDRLIEIGRSDLIR